MTNVLSSPGTAAPADRETVTEAVVDAVADAEGVSPLDIEQPLATAVDPDALGTLIDSMAAWPEQPTGHVRFEYHGHLVTVAADGEVSLSDD